MNIVKAPCICPECNKEFVGEIDNEDPPPQRQWTETRTCHSCGEPKDSVIEHWLQVCDKCLDERAGFHYKGWAIGKWKKPRKRLRTLA